MHIFSNYEVRRQKDSDEFKNEQNHMTMAMIRRGNNLRSLEKRLSALEGLNIKGGLFLVLNTENTNFPSI